MFRRVRRGLTYGATIWRALASPSQRRLLRRMIAFSRALPEQFEQPLPAMMAELTPEPQPQPPLQPATVRRLADAVAGWHLTSPLGICLRRSLLRYYFLREANLPVTIVFGARLKDDRAGGGLGGHAWLTLGGQPYYENPADYAGFAPMYAYPAAGKQGNVDLASKVQSP
ncbi:MAG: lasso peptide biosynthesis B2 protein [Anaerolineae bacterium]